MISRLRETLAKVGKPTETWKSPDGSTVLVLPYGGRILGLYTRDLEQNFFWTHTSLDSVETARAFYASKDWHNSGGDRTWLAPEMDFFLPKYPDTSAYMQPRALDPGHYELTSGNGTITVKNQLTVQLSRSKATADLEITKRLAPAPSPLVEADVGPTDLEYAGYTLYTSLEIKGPDKKVGPVGLWSLLQLPHQGEFLVPTFSKSKAKKYFGNVNESDVAISENLVRYKMDAIGEHKIGLKALSLAGRMGYISSPTKDTAALVIRNFSINPSGKYVDAPWTEPESPGAAVEACNINSNLGAFSEMEYHTPAIGGQTGLSYCEDSSQVWAFRGPRQSILAAARKLISSEV